MKKMNSSISKLLFYILLIFLVIFSGAFAVLMVEFQNQGKSFFDAIWWSLVTFTTVGFGDLYPVTFWGRMVGIIIILLGLIILALFTAFIASSFIDIKLKERRGLSNIKARKHIIICGWNQSGFKILNYLSRNPQAAQTIVLVNQMDTEKVASIQNNYPKTDIKFIKGDFTNQDILAKANVKDSVHTVILYDESDPNLPPSDERSIIAAHNLSYKKYKTKVSLQLRHEKYLPALLQDKISNIIIFDDIGGEILASSTISPDLPKFLKDALELKDNTGLRQIAIPRDFIGKTYGELFSFFHERKQLVLLGVVTIQPEFAIDDILTDDLSSIDQFIKKQFALSNKKISKKEQKNNVKIKPEANYQIQENDMAIVL